MIMLLVLPDIPLEDQLLTEARQGNQQAVMDIYEYYAAPIYQYIRLRVGDMGLAEDLASEVFLKLVDALRGKNAPHHSLRGWLFTVARNLIAQHYRTAQKMPQITLDEWTSAAPDTDPETQLFAQLDMEQTRYALRMLKEE